MDQPIIISVIVPVYNIFEYLPRCVDSIRKQTYPYLDIILVDDGSTDRTGALAEKLALEDKRAEKGMNDRSFQIQTQATR